MENTIEAEGNEDILVNLSDLGSHLDRIILSYVCFPNWGETLFQWFHFTAPKHNNLQRMAVTVMEGN